MFEAFQIGPFIIWTHLLFLLIAMWMASEFFFRLAQSAGLSLQPFRDHALWYMIGALLGGRIFAVIEQYRVYLKAIEPLRFLKLHDGNFSFLGMAVGIIIVLYITRRTSRTTFLQWLDVLLPATTFGLFLDWLGKFFAGQAYGHPTDMFWGITYDAINVRFAVPIHPVQLYYALFYFFLTFLLLVVRKNARRAGAETLFGIVLAAVATFVFEWFRGDFGIPVFATKLDFILLILLFISLGVFAAIEMNLKPRIVIIYEAVTTVFCAAYLFIRPWLPFETFELRFSQLLAILALLGAIVYVVVHRRRHPHL
jgi:phosphatidylglycerol:prolipoprotein diacylglycerol transferase